MSEIDTLIGNITREILIPIIALLFALATLYFLWGVVGFILNTDNDEERTKGKNHMIWGIVGMFIMIASYGIINIIANTLGLGFWL